MELDIVKVITEVGLPIGLVLYFIWKDYKFSERQIATQEKFIGLIETLQDKETEVK